MVEVMIVLFDDDDILQDLLCLTIFIYIIYLPTILPRFQTTRAEIYLFTTGTPYKISSRFLVLASFGGGNFHSNVPPRRHSGSLLHHKTGFWYQRPRLATISTYIPSLGHRPIPFVLPPASSWQNIVWEEAILWTEARERIIWNFMVQKVEKWSPKEE